MKKIKLIIWDLDCTIWDGVLLEDKKIELRKGVAECILAFDERGILQSVASKNDEELAIKKLKEMGLAEYFLYPQINWNPKCTSVEVIVKNINIDFDTVAFVDDNPAERDEIKYFHPMVMCLDASELQNMLSMPEFMPEFITNDSRNRRVLYMNDYKRKLLEQDSHLPKTEFLATLNMVMTIYEAKEADLRRAEELTIRTHQLNTTGVNYSYEELCKLIQSPSHKLIMVDLEDLYGSYGKVGLALIEVKDKIWILKLLLMSCRVIDKGIGGALITKILGWAKQAQVKMQAEFVRNDVNRIMYITLKFLGFKERYKNENYSILEHDLQSIQPPVSYISVYAENNVL